MKSGLPKSQEKEAKEQAQPEKIDVGAYDADDHNLSIEEAAARYSTRVDVSHVAKSQGLTASEAATRLKENGPNALTPPKTTPEIIKFLLQFTNPLFVLLIVAGILAFISYGVQNPKDPSNIYIGCTLAIVVFILAAEAYRNERAASKAANALKSLLPSITNVVRDGQESQINASDLVVGDIVHMTIGTRVPADLKVIETKDLKLDFSSLTGESDPIPMSTVAMHDAPHESHNIAFMSSQVLNGEGRGIVVRCGDETFIGKINKLTAGTATQTTTLVKDIRLFVTFIAVVAITMAIVLFGIGLGRGTPFATAFVNGLVVVLVANIPQGLPATVQAMLSATAYKMKEKRVVVKRADIVESLGCASRIASDKTGTLTQNKMTVMNCWVNRQFKSAAEIVGNAGPRKLARVSSRGAPSPTSALARVSAGLARTSALLTQRGPGLGSVPEALGDGVGNGGSLPRKSLRTTGSGIPAVDENAVDGSGHGSDAAAREINTQLSLSRGSRRFGTDMLSRMSMGASGAAPRLAKNTLARGSAMTFVISVGTQPTEEGNAFTSTSPVSKLLIIACCNNKAQFAPSDNQDPFAERKVLGDATDAGLLRFCDKLIDVDGTRQAFRSRYVIPFNSKNKWALTMVEVPGDSEHYLVMIKGAPEYVMQRCSKYLYKGQDADMDEEFKDDMTEAYESFGVMAERVIGHAYKLVTRASIPDIPSTQEDAEALGLVSDFTFCGLLSLIDPPRDAVPPAVELCRRAGVGVTMVTGDHPLTAEAIARKCNIISTPTRREVAAEYGVEEDQVPLSDPNVRALVISGAMIDKELKTDEDWDLVMSKEELVFARTTPQHKLLIVSHFQRRKEVVAVTGDGVNDSPALRRADIGVAMGNPDASEVARDAADVVLLDDDFAALVYAIADGRRLYDNLKKTIAYTLAHIPPETFAVVLNLLFGMPLGLNAMLVLTIDLITEQGPANSLAFEPAEANLMERPPRDIQKERLVSFSLLFYTYFIAGFAEGIVCIGAYLWSFRLNHVPLSDIFWTDPKKNTWLLVGHQIDTDVIIDGTVLGGGEQANIVRQANATWYVTLIMCQFWHIWCCKTRRISMFKHSGMVTNLNTFYGVIIAVTVMLLVTYVPALQDNIFYTADPPPLAAWIPHFFFLAYIVPVTELIKYTARRDPNGFVGRWIAW